MLDADNEFKKSYVVTYKELLFTFIVFAVILFVLYPKDLLKEQIVSEKSNYDLSMLYLKNLLKHDPKNESLQIILAEQSLRSGAKLESIALLDKLIKSKNEKIRKKAFLLDYELKKDNYYYIKDKKLKRKAKKELKKLFRYIYYQKLYNEKDEDKWYNEALFLDEQGPMYYFVQKKLKSEPNNVELLTKAYYLSLKFNNRKKAVKYIHDLIIYDTKNSEKWLLDNYYMLLNSKQYAEVEKLLYQKSKTSLNWKKRSADYYLMRKSFRRASRMYIELFNETKSYNKRKQYFFKAVRALQAGSYLQASANLAHRYENYYLYDREVRKFLLKIYISTSNLNYASNLSKKILKGGY